MTARRRLAFVCESGTDIRLVKGLARTFELQVLVRPAFRGREVSWPIPEEVGLKLVRGPSPRLAFSGFVTGWLFRHAKQLDAVLVQGTGLSAAASNLVRFQTRLPTLLLVCSPNTAYYRCRKGHLSPWTYGLGISALESSRRLNAVLAERYVTLSHYLAETVAEDGPARSSVIPLYGVDTQCFHPVPAGERPALRASLGLPEDRFILFFSSRVAPEKDTEVILEAAKQLMEAGERDFTLLNLSGGHREFLAKAQREGMEHFVIARDAVHPEDELPRYYQAVDLCVQASKEEGLGFSPLEALACETPVIASAVGGLRETILPGETGLTVPVGDAVAMAQQIRYARTHPDEMKEMARRGRRLVEEKFESAGAFLALEELIESMVLSRARS